MSSVTTFNLPGAGCHPEPGGAPGAPRPPIVYFVHIPKTAGITLKAFLEDNYAHGEALVIDEHRARGMSGGDLRPFRLLSGHYSSEVLRALDTKPDLTLGLVRDPVTRFRSWAAHGRRLSRPEHRVRFIGRTDLNLTQECGAFQAWWLARALRDGAACRLVPRPAELPALLGRVDLVGLTEHLGRFMQLVAFRMGWPPPPLGWHLNHSPEGHGKRVVPSRRETEDLRETLSVDADLYACAERRFWSDYAAMLTVLDPRDPPWQPHQAVNAPVETVQRWLRSSRVAFPQDRKSCPVTIIDYRADAPVAGEGWWWREVPERHPYRWTGPGASSTLELAPLQPDVSYDISVDIMGAADWPTWEGASLRMNGHRLEVVRERIEDARPGDPTLRLRAQVPPQMVAPHGTATSLEISVPETRPVPGGAMVLVSADTVNEDRRLVGLAVHRVRIEPSSIPPRRARAWVQA